MEEGEEEGDDGPDGDLRELARVGDDEDGAEDEAPEALGDLPVEEAGRVGPEEEGDEAMNAEYRQIKKYHDMFIGSTHR